MAQTSLPLNRKGNRKVKNKFDDPLARVRNKFSPRVAIIARESEDDRTQQHFVDEVNVNAIVKKYQKTGVVSHVKRVEAKYGDFTTLGDFAENMAKVAEAKQAFEQLPAVIRSKVDNDPQKFYDWLKEERNWDEAEKLGLITNVKRSETGTPVSQPPTPAEKPASPAKKETPV